MGTRGPVSELKLPPKLRLVTDKTPDATSANSAVKPTAPSKPETLPASLSSLWDEIVDELDAAGLISSVDGPLIELALRHFAVAQMASNEILDSSVTVSDERNDRVSKNPASQVFRDHSMAFLEFAKQAGLSFAARARTTVTKEAADGDVNPFAVNS